MSSARTRPQPGSGPGLLAQAWLLGVLVFFSSIASAQYTSLSTDFSGSRLFFTAAFNQRGTDQPTHGKLFIADSNGVRPFLIRARTEIIGFISNPYDLHGVDLASNNSRLSVTGYRECLASRLQFCGYMDSSDVYDNSGRHILTAGGFLQFSPNGTWALTSAVNGTSPSTSYSAIDFASGKEYVIGGFTDPRDWRVHKIADNGTVVFGYPYLRVFRPTAGLQQVPTPERSIVQAATIDAAGSTVIVEYQDGESYLSTWRLDSPLPALSLRVPQRSDYSPKISADGTTILFLSTAKGENDPQLFTMRSDGSARRQVAVIPEGITAAILSGNGQVAWAVSRTGRLLRIQLAGGAPEELIGPVAAFYLPAHCSGSFTSPRLAAARGEVVSLKASVMPGESVAIYAGSEQATVIGVGVQEVSFRIPETYTEGDITIQKAGDTRWIAQPLKFFLSARIPSGRPGVCQWVLR